MDRDFADYLGHLVDRLRGDVMDLQNRVQDLEGREVTRLERCIRDLQVRLAATERELDSAHNNSTAHVSADACSAVVEGRAYAGDPTTWGGLMTGGPTEDPGREDGPTNGEQSW